MRQGFITADLSLASCILRDKLDSGYANGDMLKAIQLYKGGANSEALKYAKNVMKHYSKINEQIKG
jgi:hypothetical protein